MKKQKELVEKPVPNDAKVVIAHYHKSNGKEFISLGKQEILVSGFSRSIKEAIPHRARVKALVATVKGKKEKHALILKNLGEELSLKNRVERIIGEYDVPTDFPKEAQKLAQSFGDKVPESELKRREDLTALPLCTIDGETAKDFDDAVCALKKGSNIEIFVAIADVSHYVKEGSALDQEAQKRATSIYYPGHCIPMLPEELSNGLCSLRPKVLRLALVVHFELGPKGAIYKPRILEAVIKSKARLTYNQVEDFYERKTDLEKLAPEDVQNSLTLLKKAARQLRRLREQRGAIDFDITESVVALDDKGEPLSVHPQNRLESHRIIEDLMVAANEVVADYFDRKHIPSVYRVHEAPNQEKLETFFKTAQAFGALKEGVKRSAIKVTEPKDLQDVMANYAKSTYKDSLNSLLLRSMMQARYSEQNLMHFGLASPAYLHFTSPIRRYADLIVHRQLRTVYLEKNHRNKLSEHDLAQIAQSISEKEVKATDLQRKIDRLYAATFMSTHVGQTFIAEVASCTDFGLFVRTQKQHVEGLVHISTISRKRVDYHPETMSLVVRGEDKRIMVGDKVNVRLINVNVDRGHIDFELIKDEKETESSESNKFQDNRKPYKRRNNKQNERRR
jgi:ribonuclease R